MNERMSEGDAWPVTRADRAALLRKYRMLAQSRRAKDTGVDSVGTETRISHPTVLRALSQEFPGALRELDVLGLPEILRRIDVLAHGTDRRPRNGNGGEATDPWLPWILAYHALMRAALCAKRAYGRSRRISASAMPELIRTASAVAGCAVDESFLRGIARPPGGRVAVVVFGELARRFDVPAMRISTTLFPPRRPAPYALPG